MLTDVFIANFIYARLGLFEVKLHRNRTMGKDHELNSARLAFLSALIKFRTQFATVNRLQRFGK